MFNVDSVIPYGVGLLVADFVAIPINVGLSMGMDDVSERDELPKNLLGVCYGLGVLALIIGGHFDSLPMFAVMAVFALAIWPLTIWRFCVAPRKRRRRS